MYKILLSVSLGIAPLCFGAQTAEDYFHGGAQSYVWEKDREAKTNILTGLRLYPSDPLLNGMAGLLKKEEKQQQQNQQQDQQKQDQQKQQDQQQQQQQQAEQKQKQESPQQQQAEQQKQQEQQQQAEQKKQEQQQAQQAEQKKQEQQQAQQASAEKEKSDEKGQEGSAAQAVAQMTPEQAKQLLDAEKDEEKLLQPKSTGKPSDNTRPFKDW